MARVSLRFCRLACQGRVRPVRTGQELDGPRLGLLGRLGLHGRLISGRRISLTHRLRELGDGAVQGLQVLGNRPGLKCATTL